MVDRKSIGTRCIGTTRLLDNHAYRILLFAHPSLRDGPDIRQPEPLQPFLRIFPRSECSVQGASDGDDDEERAEEGGERDEEVEQEEDDKERRCEQGGLVRCRQVSVCIYVRRWQRHLPWKRT